MQSLQNRVLKNSGKKAEIFMNSLNNISKRVINNAGNLQQPKRQSMWIHRPDCALDKYKHQYHFSYKRRIF